MKEDGAQAFLDGFSIVKSVLEFDSLTVQEILDAFDLESEDRLLNPWRRGYNAAIRSALGH